MVTASFIQALTPGPHKTLMLVTKRLQVTLQKDSCHRTLLSVHLTSYEAHGAGVTSTPAEKHSPGCRHGVWIALRAKTNTLLCVPPACFNLRRSYSRVLI